LFSSWKIKGFALSAGLFMSLSFTPTNVHAAVDIANGQKVYQQNCASCHLPHKVQAAPALKGAKKRWADAGIPDKIYEWVNNPGAVRDQNIPYVLGLINANKQFTFMTAQGVSKEQIDDVLAWADQYTEPGAKSGGPEPISKADMDKTYGKKEGGSWLWLVIFGVVFGIIILSIGGVRKQLRDANLEKLGKPVQEPKTYLGEIRAWGWKHKVAASLIGIFFVSGGVVDGWYALKDIGVYEGYKPEQPIWFSHQIHNGIYKIDCQYCHANVEKSRHATLPSAMVCMNCHKAIDKGTLTGTEEISKIYKATGFDPATKTYGKPGEPIKWVKVHALPDHAYFNHSQHVTVGQLDCKQCHGEMDKIDVARIQPVNVLNGIEGNVKIEGDRATLTMGWCIECHKNADVKMEGNGYYDELKKRLLTNKEEYKKHLSDDRISVKDLGGWECSKCHY
jgi:mono/diheme cytochrome c family protein